MRVLIKNEDCMEILLNSMEVRTNDGLSYLSFRTNKGRGSGFQAVLLNNLTEFVLWLEKLEVKEGAKFPIKEIPDPTFKFFQTFQGYVKDGVVSIRTKEGKGSKPMKIPVEDFERFLVLIRNQRNQINALPFCEK